MNRLYPLILLALSLFTATGIAESPNVVVIFADDLGYGDTAATARPS